MSQVGNQVGDHSSFEAGPVPPVDPRVPIINGKPAQTITLTAEEIAKIEAFRERSKGHPRVSREEFRKLRERLVNELKGRS